MYDRSLFERLADPLTPAGQGARLDDSRLAASILQNLRNLFNCREGHASIRPDLGMPDFTDVTFHYADSVGTITRAIRAQIEKFEPRLTQVSVRHHPSEKHDAALRFSVSAMIKLGDRAERIAFETVLGADGFYRVRG